MEKNSMVIASGAKQSLSSFPRLVHFAFRLQGDTMYTDVIMAGLADGIMLMLISVLAAHENKRVTYMPTWRGNARRHVSLKL
jgi:hypothetical protein